MFRQKLMLILFSFICFMIGCKDVSMEKGSKDSNALMYETEKAAIIEALNDETKAAFQRDYSTWTESWVHDPSITKTYIDYTTDSFSESVGWAEISSFVKTYIDEHPEPEPLPKLLDDVQVRLYGNGAWVCYEQLDSLRGKKKETRLMEKVEGRWKIAGMQTTIYGF